MNSSGRLSLICTIFAVKILFAMTRIQFSFLLFSIVFALSPTMAQNKKATKMQFNALTGFETFAENSVKHQSSACYGRFLFLIPDKMSRITMYDLAKKRIIFTCELTPHLEKCNTTGVLSDILYHCNESNFGNERYGKDDIFPLLYVSQRNTLKENRALLSVLRIITFGKDKAHIDSFTVEEVQRIFFPVMTDANGMGTPNVAIDTEGGYMYPYCRNNRLDAPDYLKAVVAKLKLPKLRDSRGNVVKEVFLENKDILQSFKMDWNIQAAQGGFVREGKLILMQGFPNKKPEKNHIWLRVIDLEKQEQTLAKDLVPLGFKWEPEGVFYYKGQVMTSVNGKGIFVMKFK